MLSPLAMPTVSPFLLHSHFGFSLNGFPYRLPPPVSTVLRLHCSKDEIPDRVLKQIQVRIHCKHPLCILENRFGETKVWNCQVVRESHGGRPLSQDRPQISFRLCCRPP